MSRDPKSTYYDAGGIETLDILKAKLTPEQYRGSLLGNVIKYACRLNFKGCAERDAEKLAIYSKELAASTYKQGGGSEEVQIADDDSCATKIRRIGDEIHNLSCRHQNVDDLSGELGSLSFMCWAYSKEVAALKEENERLKARVAELVEELAASEK